MRTTIIAAAAAALFVPLMFVGAGAEPTTTEAKARVAQETVEARRCPRGYRYSRRIRRCVRVRRGSH